MGLSHQVRIHDHLGSTVDFHVGQIRIISKLIRKLDRDVSHCPRCYALIDEDSFRCACAANHLSGDDDFDSFGDDNRDMTLSL